MLSSTLSGNRRGHRAGKVATAVAALTITALLGGTPGPAAAQPVESIADAATSTLRTTSSQVTIGKSSFPVAGTNIPREADALVVYTAPLKTTPAAKGGVAVKVVNGKVKAIKSLKGNARSVAIPAKGFVLSGQGKAAAWLKANAKLGKAVSLGHSVEAPSPVVSATAPMVQIGSATFSLTGTNVDRGVDAMVRYQAPLTVTPTNMWGVEVSVLNGKITAVNDREKSRSTAGTKVPAGGFVISGHYKAAEWLRANAKVGAGLTVNTGSVETPRPTEPAPPATAVMPVAGQSMTIGSASRTLAGVNISRNVDALVAYGDPVKVTPTNEWGVEVGVVAGKVVSVNDREPKRDIRGTAVPAGGYILSGHGKAADWLRANAKVGAAVSTGAVTQPTQPTPSPQPTQPTPTTPAPGDTAPIGTDAPMGLPTKVQALYQMMWGGTGTPLLRTLPSEINVVNLAFLQGSTPTLVGWGSEGESRFIAEAKALRARGVRIVASVGGAHGHVNVADREGFVRGVMALNAKLPLDGLDWDIEGGTAMAPADVVWISKRLKELRGDKFAITMAPNGSNIDHYRNIAVELNKVGALDMIGQQFYDAVVSKDAAKGRITQLVNAGIPQNKIGIGMMVGSQDVYWTVDECIDAVRYIKASYPNLRGGYLWEAGRAGTADWASRLSPLLKG